MDWVVGSYLLDLTMGEHPGILIQLPKVQVNTEILFFLPIILMEGV